MEVEETKNREVEDVLAEFNGGGDRFPASRDAASEQQKREAAVVAEPLRGLGSEGLLLVHLAGPSSHAHANVMVTAAVQCPASPTRRALRCSHSANCWALGGVRTGFRLAPSEAMRTRSGSGSGDFNLKSAGGRLVSFSGLFVRKFIYCYIFW